MRVVDLGPATQWLLEQGFEMRIGDDSYVRLECGDESFGADMEHVERAARQHLNCMLADEIEALKEAKVQVKHFRELCRKWPVGSGNE